MEVMSKKNSYKINLHVHEIIDSRALVLFLFFFYVSSLIDPPRQASLKTREGKRFELLLLKLCEFLPEQLLVRKIFRPVAL